MKKLNLIVKENKKDLEFVDIREEDIAKVFIKELNLLGTSNEMCIRTYGNFSGKAMLLNNLYDYVVGLDSLGMKILVPLKENTK